MCLERRTPQCSSSNISTTFPIFATKNAAVRLGTTDRLLAYRSWNPSDVRKNWFSVTLRQWCDLGQSMISEWRWMMDRRPNAGYSSHAAVSDCHIVVGCGSTKPSTNHHHPSLLCRFGISIGVQYRTVWSMIDHDIMHDIHLAWKWMDGYQQSSF